MTTARTTRLVRVPDLRTFRTAVADLACGGSPFDIRRRLVVVPTRAAASYLVRSIEQDRLGPADALVLPDFVTRGELHERLAERLPQPLAVLSETERDVLMGTACRGAIEDGVEPPFRLRPGLVAEVLRFYDTLQRNLKTIDIFERLALGMLEPGAADDRGAERLVRQTRFLVRAFHHFERLRQEAGMVDEHLLRRALVTEPASDPWRHVVLSVGDRGSDAYGVFSADWDLLARLPGLERLDIVATDATVAGAFHERIHRMLPGVEEVRVDAGDRRSPVLLIPPGDACVHAERDREEEVSAFARWVRHEPHALDRVALVVRRPLPYVYAARDILSAAGIPSQMFDALPLAAEPFAAALDLVFTCATSDGARGPAAALLGSPHFDFVSRPLTDALPAVAQELAPLRHSAPCAQHLDCVLQFLRRHERLPAADDPLAERLLRGRSAILDTLTGLRDAYERFDPTPVDFEEVPAIVRRRIEVHTFTPHTGDRGVHLVDADSARFGDFERVQLAGLVDGEWPDGPRRNIFYPPRLLRDLEWPPESERLDGIRAAFADLLRLPSLSLRLSTFTLEDDALTTVSPLVDAVASAGLETAQYVAPPTRIFEFEALAFEPVETGHLDARARAAALRRIDAARDVRDRPGATAGHRPPAYSLSALERYQDCPFKFFAADVLRLEEPEDDDPLSPRARGKFVHEVFQHFFEAWDRRSHGTITVDRLDEARALFDEVAEPMLARLPDAEAALQRAHLFGSAVARGIVNVVLELEASRPADVSERWLEYRLEGSFSLGSGDGRQVSLKGVADRVDLLAGRRIRVIDYKSGYPPNPKRALQAPVYALCAQERLEARDGAPWVIDEAAYVAFSGKRALVPVVRAGAQDADEVLSSARSRLFQIVDGIEAGAFPPRPHELRMCTYCAYPSVCRKDYVGDE